MVVHKFTMSEMNKGSAEMAHIFFYITQIYERKSNMTMLGNKVETVSSAGCDGQLWRYSVTCKIF